MNNRLVSNPFSVSVYLGPEYFCDRENETKGIIDNLINGNSITLIALRRLGKTALIHHVMEKLPSDINAVYLDILETENMNEFLNQLISAILNRFPQKTRFGKKIWDFLVSMRPNISFDPLTGYPQVTITSEIKETKTNISSVFNFLEQQNTTTVIAIDEFQQILEYPESNTDAWLRSRIQTLKNVRFIFSGSQQHLMNELFSNPQRPFYRSAHLIKLSKISREEYSAFIIKQFQNHKKKITTEISEQILEWCDDHTYFVQYLCNRLFANSTEKLISEQDWKTQASMLLEEQQSIFFTFRNMLTEDQWKLFKAIAKEGKTFAPTSQKFIKKYKLKSSASILRAIKSLLNSELIFMDFDNDGKQYYCVYDLFFRRWSENR